MSGFLDLDSQPVPRLAAQAVARALRVMPVVAVMGARQTGKSTLVQSFPPLDSRPYLTLDDLDVRSRRVSPRRTSCAGRRA